MTKDGHLIDTETNEEVPYEVEPENDDAGLFEKVKQFVNELIHPPKPVLEYSDGVVLSKEADGRTRFFMPFTNNFEDRHKEIFALESHKEFERWVDQEDAYPDVWLWHVPGTKWGKCDYVAVDDSGFGICSGIVDAGLEHIAKSIADDPNIGVSHSCWALQKDDTIEHYWTYEISPLPIERAANQLHGGVKLLEDTMTLDPTKRAWLVEHAGEEFVTKLEKDFESRAKTAISQGVKSKEEGSEGEPEANTETPATNIDETLVSALQAVVSPLETKLDALGTELTELKTKQKSIDDRAEELFSARVPNASGYVASEKAKSDREGEERNPNFEWMAKSRGAFAITPGVEE